MGTDETFPYDLTWDTTFVPDQDVGAVKFIALIQDDNDVWYAANILWRIRGALDAFYLLQDIDWGYDPYATLEKIIEHMVGRSVEEMFPRLPHERGEALLELDSLAGERRPRRASLTLHRGEILGIAGLVGAGRTEMLRAIFGLEPVRTGRVTLAHVGEITHVSPTRAIGVNVPRQR